MLNLVLQVLLNGILLGGFYALVTLGLNLIFGVMDITNFAHGDLIMLAAYFSFWAAKLFGIDPVTFIPVNAAIMFIVGLIFYRVALKPVLRAPAYNQIALTFGFSIFLQSLALVLWTSDMRQVEVPYASIVFQVGPVSVGLGKLIAFGIALGFTLGFLLFLERTKLGGAMRSVSQDPMAASLMGINVNRIYLITSGIASMLAGVAGSLVTLNLYINPFIGGDLTLKAFGVVILGGMGSYLGMIIASMILGLAEALVGAFLPLGGSLAPGIAFAVIVAVLAIRPTGLFGK